MLDDIGQINTRNAHDWLIAFSGGKADASALFAENALWRDYLAFELDLQTLEGHADIAAHLPKSDFTLNPEIEAVSAQEYLFWFTGPYGPAQGLVSFESGKCTRLFTSLTKLNSEAETSNNDAPFVLIIGAGQSGLALAARLAAASVPYLVVEAHTRIGDNWRNRYESLILHDPVWVNHLPFKPFPETWPIFTPKDMMGDWLEGYADTLGLNVWCDCKLTDATFDADKAQWHINLMKSGKQMQLHVPHLVFALGTSGFAHTPDFPGADIFAGQQMHSSAYKTGRDFTGKNVAIIGATNSAHDIAVDLVKNGAHPTLIQRSSTHVVPHKVYVEKILGALYSPELQNNLERSDFLSMSIPMRGLEAKGRALFDEVKEEWSDFFDGLTKTGFCLDFAEDGTGIIGKYRRSASGYYIDVGGSQRVMDGEISVRSGVGVSALTSDSIALTDGSNIDADAVIYATGFGSMEEWVARLIDQDTADKVGRCWGYGSGYRGDPGPWEGELRNMWKPTAQTGLWFMGGNLAQVRIYSRYLGLQLSAQYQGIT